MEILLSSHCASIRSNDAPKEGESEASFPSGTNFPPSPSLSTFRSFTMIQGGGGSRSNRKRQVSSSINQKSRAEGRRMSLKTNSRRSPLAPSLFRPVSWRACFLHLSSPLKKLTNNKSLSTRRGVGRDWRFRGIKLASSVSTFTQRKSCKDDL